MWKKKKKTRYTLTILLGSSQINHFATLANNCHWLNRCGITDLQSQQMLSVNYEVDPQTILSVKYKINQNKSGLLF